MPKQPGEELQIFFHRQAQVEVFAQALRHIGNLRTDAVTLACFCQIGPKHCDFGLAVGGLLDLPRTGQDRQQAGFADAVRAEQSDHLTGRNI